MPIFDFKCPKCNNIDERIVSHGTTENICSKCANKSEKIDKIYNSNFKLNGKWFKTTKEY